MSFAEPGVLLAGLVVLLVLVAGLRRADRRRRADLARFASDHVLADLTADVSVRRRRVKRAMVVSGVALVLIALAGPEIGHRFEESRRRGIDVLIAVDVSRSMLAGDVQPNRLERAKLAVADLVGQLGDRVGLIAFAGSAFLQCPLTLDQRAFDESLAVLAPDLIPEPGSDIASAIRVAEKALSTEKRNVKLLVIFSDGEDLGGDAVETAGEAAEKGLRIFTVGVGTPAGELIPVPTEGGGTDFVKDSQGQIVKSRLDEKTLTDVAEATGGFYVPLGPRGEGIVAIRERALAPIPKEELAARLRQVPLNRYQWPLLLGIVLLFVEPLVSDRRRTTKAGATTALAASVLLAIGSTLLADTAHAASPAEAKRLYDAGKYAEARDAYRAAQEADPENPDLDFNLGAAAYKAGELADAATAFSRALRSEEPARQQQSFYNLGNTQFRLGEATRESDPQQTMAAWQQAVEAFDQALKLNGEDADAQYNREVVTKALEELQQQQQQQQNQDGEKNDEKQQENQQQQDQRQGQQDQQQQGQQQQDQQQQGQDQQQQQQGQQQQDQQQGQQQQDQQQAQQQEGQQQQQDAGAKQDEAKGDEQTPKPAEGSEQAPSEQAAADASETAIPGRMTPTEARALLESLRGEDRALPMLGHADQGQRPPGSAVQDW